MSHPRAVFPPDVIAFYQANGARRTCAAYRTQWRTLRRWLVEHGVEVRPQGLRLGQTLRSQRQAGAA